MFVDEVPSDRLSDISSQALQDVPQLADELEAELTFSLKTYGEQLASAGQSKNALWLYSQVRIMAIPYQMFRQIYVLHRMSHHHAMGVASPAWPLFFFFFRVGGYLTLHSPRERMRVPNARRLD